MKNSWSLDKIHFLIEQNIIRVDWLLYLSRNWLKYSLGSFPTHILLKIKLTQMYLQFKWCALIFFFFFFFCFFLSHLLVAGCDIGVRFSVRPSVCSSVSPSVSPSVRLSTFMSTFDIYVKVSILINYKTNQPLNLAWNISLTSWLQYRCPLFCMSVHSSVRLSTFMSKFDIYVKVSILINYKTKQHQTLHETSPWPSDFAT